MVSELEEATIDLLNELDCSDGVLVESHIAGRLHELIRKSSGALPPDAPPPFMWIAEYLAFSLVELPDSPPSVWGSHYFGPSLISEDTKGRPVNWPDIQAITPDVVRFWIVRASQARHPSLRARYAWLAWDFSKLVLNTRPDRSFVDTVVLSVLDLSKKSYPQPQFLVLKKLQHALRLAASINATGHIDGLKNAILSKQHSVSDDRNCGIWGLTSDIVLADKETERFFTPSEKADVVRDLESRLYRLIANSDNPWPASRDAAVRLAMFYKKGSDNKIDDVRRVMTAYGESVLEFSQKESSLKAMGVLEDLLEFYNEYGLKSEARRLEVDLGLVLKKAAGEFKPLTVPIQFSEETMNRLTALDAGTNLAQDLAQIAQSFILKPYSQIDRVATSATGRNLLSTITTSVMDGSGRSDVRTEPLKNGEIDRYDPTYVHQIQFMSVFLGKTIENLLAKHKPDARHLSALSIKSGMFSLSRDWILAEAFNAYLNGSNMVFVHLLIPQIEEAFRSLADRHLISTTKQKKKPRNSRTSGVDTRLLDDLLTTKSLVDKIGTDTAYYFRMMLTDNRGRNLRNRVCHGLIDSEGFTREVADRIFHIWACLVSPPIASHGVVPN